MSPTVVTLANFTRQDPCLDQRQVVRRSTRDALDGAVRRQPEPARAVGVEAREGAILAMRTRAVNVASPADQRAAATKG